MNPAPTRPGSLRFAVGAVCGLRNAVALTLLPERLAGQAEELCGFGLVVLCPLQRFEDVLPLELLPGGVQPIHQRRSLVHHGRPFAAKPARRLRRAPAVKEGKEPAEVPRLDLADVVAPRKRPPQRVLLAPGPAGKRK